MKSGAPHDGAASKSQKADVKRLIFILSLAIILPCFGSVPGHQSEREAKEFSQKVAESFLPLLDAQKYSASWEFLSPLAKETLSKRNWIYGLAKLRQPLGKLKSRKLLETKYINPLPGYPDQEGALVRFESHFNNGKTVIESVGTIRDKDGIWRVGAYMKN